MLRSDHAHSLRHNRILADESKFVRHRRSPDRPRHLCRWAFSSRLIDIAIDPFTYIIYAVSGSSKYFYSVDKETGLDLKFGNTNLLPQRGGGLAADSHGVLYGTNDKTLFTYDKVTGDATGIGSTGLSAFVNALDFTDADVLYDRSRH